MDWVPEIGFFGYPESAEKWVLTEVPPVSDHALAA